MIKKIPFFNYPEMFLEHKSEYMLAIESVLSKGAFIMQSELTSFENELAEYLNVPYVIGVADGTIALKISLTLAGIGPGDEVILPSHTFIATASAVHQLGGVPVICDCRSDSMIDIESAVRVLSSATKAIMPVQLNGRTCDMDAVEGFATEHSLKIVEDSCQAMGAKYRDRFAGTFGVAGSFSFFPAKTLGCFGDGGAVIVGDADLARQARELRDHGRGADGKVRQFGVNGRLDNLQAAILSVKLRRYDETIARRRAIATLYNGRLSDVTRLTLPPAPGTDPLRFDIFQNYEIQADNRDALRSALADAGVGTIMQWGGHMIHQFDDLNLRSDSPYAETMSQRFMMLPMHPLLSDDDVHYICDSIIKFYQTF